MRLFGKLAFTPSRVFSHCAVTRSRYTEPPVRTVRALPLEEPPSASFCEYHDLVAFCLVLGHHVTTSSVQTLMIIAPSGALRTDKPTCGDHRAKATATVGCMECSVTFSNHRSSRCYARSVVPRSHDQCHSGGCIP